MHALAIALGLQAAGKSVYFATLAELVDSMRKAEGESKLRERGALPQPI